MYRNFKFIFFTIILAMSMVACTAAATKVAVERITAHAYYNNEESDMIVYDVEGHKYAKLVDMAQLLSKSSSCFNVSSAKNKIILTKGEKYSDNDAFKLNGKKYTTAETDVVKLCIDGKNTTFNSYVIDGEYYFSFADLAEVIGYTLNWNSDDFILTITDGEGARAAYVAMPLTTDDEYDMVDGVLQKKTERVVDPNKPMIALTFDDGPARGSTELILDALDQVDGRATFFVVGSRVATYPDLVKRINDQGSQIGNHSYTHAYLSKMSLDAVKTEINKTSNSVFDAAGVYPMIGRPPYGSVSATMRSATNIKWYNWNVDTLDWKYKDSEYVYNYVINNAKDGDVILMHDLHQTTGEAMQRAIPKLSEMGFQLVTIDEMAAVKGGYENVNGYIK